MSFPGFIPPLIIQQEMLNLVLISRGINFTWKSITGRSAYLSMRNNEEENSKRRVMALIFHEGLSEGLLFSFRYIIIMPLTEAEETLIKESILYAIICCLILLIIGLVLKLAPFIAFNLGLT